MAAARLSVILILLLFKGSCGQQLSLCNKPTCGSCSQLGCAQQEQQRKSGLTINSMTFHPISKPCNTAPNFNVPVPQSNCRSNMQKTVNLQPPVCSQQPVQCQSSVNQELNYQQPQLRQNLPLNLQQQILQQQQAPLPVTNVQLSPIQTTNCPLTSMPIVNGQISGLPSQISQGVLLSNLGLTSTLPSLLPNACGSKPAEQLSVVIPQSNQPPIFNSPIYGIDVSRSATPQQIPISVSSVPVECSNSNNNVPTFTYQIPASAQNNGLPKQSQSLDISSNSFVQAQPSQNQVQPQPVGPGQSQTISTSAQIQSQSLPSFVLSQIQPQNSNPQYSVPVYSPNPILNQLSSNLGPKSSSIKALLPLIFNLLKEKNGCGCPPNYNYGNCMNNNNINKNALPEPQVFGGYSNLSNYGKEKEETPSNVIETEKTEDTEKGNETKSHKKHKNKKPESAEYEDDSDSDEDNYDDN